MFGHLLRPPAWKQSGAIPVERDGWTTEENK